ncbi:MAG TPA: ABC transporter substrate-binding protein [Thermodesulfobacteriota bacterium]|nr:ABC transporter substrate-binding protein [Thermodesulfobacteriota bacterium]
MERKIHWALGAFLGMAILFSGAVSPAADMVKIGASYPTSGGVAEAASWVIDGLKMAVEDINAKGGIPIEGKQLKVEMVLYDSKCDPTTGVGAVEKLISRDRVVAITGDYCSSVTLAEKEVSGRNKIVQVTPIAIHPKITEPGYPYMFRICNTIDMYVAPMVDFVATRLKIKNISLLAVTDDYGRGEVTSYSEQYAKKGVKVTGVEYFKHGDTDFYTQITKLLATKPEAMYVVTNEDSQNIGALKQIRELGFKGQLIGCSTYNTDNMVKLRGSSSWKGCTWKAPIRTDQGSISGQRMAAEI